MLGQVPHMPNRFSRLSPLYGVTGSLMLRLLAIRTQTRINIPCAFQEVFCIGAASRSYGRLVGDITSDVGEYINAWAPGESILTLDAASDDGIVSATGTSPAAGLSCGAITSFISWEGLQNDGGSVDKVQSRFFDNALRDKLDPDSIEEGSGSPNILVNTGIQNPDAVASQIPYVGAPNTPADQPSKKIKRHRKGLVQKRDVTTTTSEFYSLKLKHLTDARPSHWGTSTDSFRNQYRNRASYLHRYRCGHICTHRKGDTYNNRPSGLYSHYSTSRPNSVRCCNSV